MYALFKKSNGLQFMNVVANTKEEIIKYLEQENGYFVETPAEDWTPTNRVYEKQFVPYYKKELYEIKKINNLSQGG